MTELLRLTEVAPGVWVAHSRRYDTTSTVLLDGKGGALVIDPSWDADELAAIPADLASLGVRCVAPYTCTSPTKHGPYSQPGGVPTSVSCGGGYLKKCPHAYACFADLTPARLWPAVAEGLRPWLQRSRSA